MRVSLFNGLDDCPSDCTFRDIENEIVYVKSFENENPQIMVVVTCKHLDVCKLREESQGDAEDDQDTETQRTCGQCGHYEAAPDEWCQKPFGRCHPLCIWAEADDKACDDYDG